MTVNRIDRIQDRVQVQQVEVERVQQRLDLFNLNTFERVGSVALDDGTRVEIPSMTDSDRAAAARLFAGVPEARRETLNQAAQALGEAIYAESKSGNLTGTASPSFLTAYASAAQAYTSATTPQIGSAEVNQAFMGTMYMGLVGLEGDLENQARGVQARNQMADELRTDITEIRNELANWGDPNSTKTFTYTQVNPDGTTEVVSKTVNKAEAEALMKDLEEQLASVKDMTEMDKLTLQQNLQDYQQALQTFSAILKESHDTMKATINNLKA